MTEPKAIDTSKYFYRNAVFTRKDGQVALTDINNPEISTPLDEWLGTVLSLADGQHTIEEMVNYLRGHYQYPQAPPNLEETIFSVIGRLIDGDLIQLSDKKIELPYYLASPIEELDIEKAQKLISEDQLKKH